MSLHADIAKNEASRQRVYQELLIPVSYTHLDVYKRQSKGYAPQTAYQKDFKIHDFHFLTMPVDMHHVTFKIRHTPEFHSGIIEQTAPDSYTVHAETAIHRCV